MAKNVFDKFINKEPKGAKKKELFKQEKRKLKKEASAAGEELRRKKKAEKYGTSAGTNEVRSSKYEAGDKVRSTKQEVRNVKSGTGDKVRSTKYEVRNVKSRTGDKIRNTKYEARNAKSEGKFTKKEAFNPAKDEKKVSKTRHTLITKKNTASFDNNKPAKEISFDKPAKPGYTANKRAVTKAKTEDPYIKPAVEKRQIAKPAQKADGDWQPKAETPETAPAKRTIKRQQVIKQDEEPEIEAPRHNRLITREKPETGNIANSSIGRKPVAVTAKTDDEQMPLNKYISHAGVCARREAAILVKQGKVTVNGSIIYEPGFKVTAADKVLVKDKLIYLQHNPVYILLNKPKDYLTTAKDPEGRKTVFDIVAGATSERVFPVGRLDRNTTGVLLLTNDGELAQKLTHPSYEIKKIYEVKLDKDLTKKDFEAILEGVTLEDGFVAADTLAYADSKDKSIIGIEIHSGRNRIVRRIFEHLGYDVRGLDRVMFANLTKKNVDRGKYRFLSEKEVRLLKFMNQSFLRKGKEITEE